MEQKVRFHSDGFQIAGVLYEPEGAAAGSCPGIMMCQGMVGIKEYFWFPQIGRRLADMGVRSSYLGLPGHWGKRGRVWASIPHGTG